MNSTQTRYYMQLDRQYDSNLWHIFDRERTNEFGERWCEHAYLSYQDAKSLLEELNTEIELLPAGDAGMYPAAHPRPSDSGIPALLADSYDSTAEFQSEVRRLWSLDECLSYPCAVTLTHALELLRGMAKHGGYDVLLPGYEKFIAACQDDALLMDADRLLQDYQPRAERDSTHYGLVRR